MHYFGSRKSVISLPVFVQYDIKYETFQKGSMLNSPTSQIRLNVHRFGCNLHGCMRVSVCSYMRPVLLNDITLTRLREYSFTLYLLKLLPSNAVVEQKAAKDGRTNSRNREPSSVAGSIVVTMSCGTINN